MTEQTQIDQLRESNDDLVSYIQSYQGQVAGLQFQLVQAERNVQKASERSAGLQEELAAARQRITELESTPEPEAPPAEEAPVEEAPVEETPVAKVARKAAASQ